MAIRTDANGGWRSKSEEMLAGYILQRVKECGGATSMGHLQHELYDPDGVIADVMRKLEMEEKIKLAGPYGMITLPDDRG